jgi:hypothetical protein
MKEPIASFFLFLLSYGALIGGVIVTLSGISLAIGALLH